MAPRGHVKSSALQTGAATPSPVFRARFTTGSTTAGRSRLPPSNSWDPDPVVATVPVSGTTGCIWPSGAGLVGGATVLGMFSVLRRPPPVLFVSTLSAQGTPQIFERGQIMILKTQKGGVPPLVLAAASDR